MVCKKATQKEERNKFVHSRMTIYRTGGGCSKINSSALQGRWREATEGSHVHKNIFYVCIRGCETPQARWASSPTRRSSCFSQVLLQPHIRTIAYVGDLSCDSAAGMPHLLQIHVAAHYKNTAGRSPDFPAAPRKKAFYLTHLYPTPLDRTSCDAATPHVPRQTAGLAARRPWPRWPPPRSRAGSSGRT